MLITHEFQWNLRHKSAVRNPTHKLMTCRYSFSSHLSSLLAFIIFFFFFISFVDWICVVACMSVISGKNTVSVVAVCGLTSFKFRNGCLLLFNCSSRGRVRTCRSPWRLYMSMYECEYEYDCEFEYELAS